MPNFSGFLSYVVVVTFTPGPNNLMSMISSGKSGYRRTLPFIMGVTVGFFCLVLASFYFNKALMETIPEIQWGMKLLGTLYMFYLALKILGIDLIGLVAKKESKKDIKVLYGFKAGVVLQFINPKAILYAVTVVSGFIAPYYSSHANYFMFSAFLASMAFLSNTTWALFGQLLNRFISRYERPFNFAMAILLLYSAYALWK